MRFLFITDSQIKGINPSIRKGNFLVDILDKHREVFDIAKSMACDYVFHGGDVFDSPTVSLSVCDAFVDLIEAQDKPLLTIYGNHDEIGASKETSGLSILSHIFKRSKKIEKLARLEIDECLVDGHDFYYGIETSIKEKGLFSGDVSKRIKIALVHAMILDDDFINTVDFVRMDEIETDYDFIFLGHYHPALGSNQFDNSKTKTGKTIFIGPGALSRMSIGKGDRDLKPSCVFFDTRTLEMKFIELKNIKPYEDLFDLTDIEEKQEADKTLDSFMEKIQSIQYQGLSISSVLTKIKKDQPEIPADVIDEILSRMTRLKK